MSILNTNESKLTVFLLVVNLTAPGRIVGSWNNPEDEAQELPRTQLCRHLNHRPATAGSVGTSWSAQLLLTSVRGREVQK